MLCREIRSRIFRRDRKDIRAADRVNEIAVVEHPFDCEVAELERCEGFREHVKLTFFPQTILFRRFDKILIRTPVGIHIRVFLFEEHLLFVEGFRAGPIVSFLRRRPTIFFIGPSPPVANSFTDVDEAGLLHRPLLDAAIATLFFVFPVERPRRRLPAAQIRTRSVATRVGLAVERSPRRITTQTTEIQRIFIHRTDREERVVTNHFVGFLERLADKVRFHTLRHEFILAIARAFGRIIVAADAEFAALSHDLQTALRIQTNRPVDQFACRDQFDHAFFRITLVAAAMHAIRDVVRERVVRITVLTVFFTIVIEHNNLQIIQSCVA